MRGLLVLGRNWYQGEEDERPAGAGEDRRVALVRVAAVDLLLALFLALLLVRALPVNLPVRGLDLLRAELFLRFVTDFSLDLLEGGAVVALVAGPQTYVGGVGGAGLLDGVRLGAGQSQPQHHHTDPHLGITLHQGTNRSSIGLFPSGTCQVS